MRELLLGNWKTKAWAFALAVLLWYHANQQVLETNMLTVPVAVVSPPDVHVVVKRPANQFVEVRVRGRPTAVAGLRGEQLQVLLGVKRPTERERTEQVELTAKFVRGLPQNVEVTGFDPNEVVLELSLLGTQTLPVAKPSPAELGPPKAGYEVAEIDVYPSEVEVRGPMSVLSDTQAIPVKPMTISPRETGWVERSNWPLADQLEGQPVHPDPPWVDVYILIVQETKSREFTVPVDLAVPARYPYQATVAEGSEEVTVEVEGPSDLVEELTAEDLQVVASVRELTHDETMQSAPARVILPEGVKLVSDLPQVKVDIRERPPAPPVP